MQTITAKVVEDSISSMGHRLTTLQLCYPRVIHGELMTHRVFSRNAMSSRAVPVAKMIAQVRDDPWIPTHWGKNQAGMQAGGDLTPAQTADAREIWLEAATRAAESARWLAHIGLHKQIANRLLEPFQWMHTIVSASQWENFFALRDHPAAEPHFQDLARAIRMAMASVRPKRCIPGDWHLPYVSDAERRFHDLQTCLKLSTARCARVSYLNHDGTNPDVDKDVALHDKLVLEAPIHASPSEHQGTPHVTMAPGISRLTGNFVGWSQYRKFIELRITPH